MLNLKALLVFILFLSATLSIPLDRKAFKEWPCIVFIFSIVLLILILERIL